MGMWTKHQITYKGGKDHSEVGVGEIIHEPTVGKVKVVKINQDEGRLKQLMSPTNLSGEKEESSDSLK